MKIGSNMLLSYEFGPYRLEPNGRRLFRGDECIAITGKPFDTLLAIVQGKGEVVETEQLFSALWPGDKSDLSDKLRKHVEALRRTLGPDGTGRNYIGNVPAKGYFICVRVTEVAANGGRNIGETHSQSANPEIMQRVGLGLAIAVLIVSVTLHAILQPHEVPLPKTPQWGRLLVNATSEGKTPQRIALGHSADIVAVTPDGLKVYALSVSTRTMSIIHTTNGTVGTLTLPWEALSLTMSPSGRRLYVGSRVSGIAIIDTATDRLLPEMIQTGGPVFDIAITPNGKKLFMAMSRQGVKRLDTGSGDMRQITDRICAQYLEVDSRGKTLYVSYQCGGPVGHGGHDSVEVFDAETEKSLAIVTGPPMVGGNPLVSPDGRLVVLDGQNACWSPEYDHKGCPSAIYRVVHFMWADTRQVVKTLGIPKWTYPGGFIDPGRLLLLGNSISVMDTATYAVLEKWDRKPEEDHHGVAVLPFRRRVYVGTHDEKALLVLEAETGACSPPAEGLASFYPGDGVPEDTVGGAALTIVGDVRFVPGRVGQAFLLVGSGYLTAPWTGYYRFGYRDSSVALYVKFTSIEGEMTILDRASPDTQVRARLAKTEDNHFIFEFGTTRGGPIQLRSTALAVNNQWYHLAVTKSDEAVALYIDGELQDLDPLGSEHAVATSASGIPLYLGATSDRKALLHGKLDEVLFYDRALTGDEIRQLYKLRESGVCGSDSKVNVSQAPRLGLLLLVLRTYSL